MIIGIDPSLTGTAIYHIGQGNEGSDYITLKVKGEERLVHIRDHIQHMLDMFAFSDIAIQLVCIEGYAFARPNQAHQIGELGGVIRVLLYESGLPWIEIAPAALKKFATGKGNATKDQIMLHVFKRWGFEAPNNNIADAYALAQMGVAIATGDHGLTQAQAEALEKPRRAFELLMCEKEEQTI